MQQISIAKYKYCFCELDFIVSLVLKSNGLVQVKDTFSFSPGCTAIRMPVGFNENHLKDGFFRGIEKAMNATSCVAWL